MYYNTFVNTFSFHEKTDSNIRIGFFRFQLTFSIGDYILLRRENIRPNAMKNAAMIRISVSGPVLVSVIFAGAGFAGVTGATAGAFNL